jgi:hypothetical protein
MDLVSHHGFNIPVEHVVDFENINGTWYRTYKFTRSNLTNNGFTPKCGLGVVVLGTSMLCSF